MDSKTHVLLMWILNIMLIYNQKVAAQLASKYSTLSAEQVRQLRQAFRPTVASFEDDDDNLHSSAQVVFTKTPTYDEETNFLIRNAIPLGQLRPQIALKSAGVRKATPFPQVYRQQLEKEKKPIDPEEKEKEIEEPDRLTILLPQSKFDCTGKSTGYYADDGLGCEVFHYCQNNAKHSWICPEGFTFHQVNLICMPPGQENICQQSSQFHFVNEFLYKPLNLEEHQTKPNVTLRYSDRFYPSPNHHNFRHENDEEQELPPQHKQLVRVAFQQPPALRGVPVQRRPVPAPFSATVRTDVALGQVFRSPEEVNISLQQRRPQHPAQRYLENQEY